MSRPSKTWLITDTHFFEEEMCVFCGRPQNFTELILGNLKKYIQPADTLIHLGDVIDYKRRSELAELLNSIPCVAKILIMGNHDKQSRGWYARNGFSFVCDMLVIGEIALSHKPIPLPVGVKRNIHGHFHNTDWKRHEPHFLEFYGPQHKLYALEDTNYRPVELYKC